ncbi:DUF6438 domain-containing protein [Flavobacterium qiangtangense]|uniref:DUF6438 domain-containing protein n=1 Tax=Flavobacterium qiangtangense TaxID=1442595 RepID=A0ABW1PMV3_9FLAO
MKNLLIPLLVVFTLISCNQNLKLENNNPLNDSLIGDWEPLPFTPNDSSEFIIVPPVGISYGYSFSKDSIDFFTGLFDFKRDTSPRGKTVKYLGNFKHYKLDKNKLFIKNSENGKWQEFWTIKEIKNDTLFIVEEDGNSNKLKRIKHKDSFGDFDKIIYSSTGCYGTCPILNVSLDRDGNVLFYGEAYVKSIGFYKGKVEQKYTAFIFKKFEKANVKSLKSHYSEAITDSQTITTTFLKEGKIIESIFDHARQAPKELLWAYVPIANIFDSHKLLKVTEKEELPKVKLLDFSLGEKKLQLLESEGFYLWTELWKSAKTETKFKETYNLSFENYRQKNEANQTIKITSDGRYFKFKSIEKTTTYDLGYNFIEKNFKKSDIKKVEEYKLPNS